MRRFLKTFKLGHKTIKLYVAEYDDRKDEYLAIGSGIPFEQPHYLFLDYDEKHVMKEWQHIVDEYELRRALIIESSPERYWFISFSPMHIADICEIMYFSEADKKHCASMMRDGAVYIRVDSKVRGYPKIFHELINRNGTNFYDYDKEKVFRELIGAEPFRNIPLMANLNHRG